MENSLSIPDSNKLNLSRRILFTQLANLEYAGLTIVDEDGEHFFGDSNSSLQAQIEMNSACYTELLLGGSIGAAETYMKGAWDTPDLTAVIQVFARNLKLINQIDSYWAMLAKPANLLFHWLKRNTKSNSRDNIAAHYDLSNDMYQLMLDPLMQYSSGLYLSEQESLEQAQINKLNRICGGLNLNKNDHLLEIGSGWGGLACFAAEHFHCQVTTITLSEQQYQYVNELIQKKGLQDKVKVCLIDYRDVEGQYDKIVSIEMIEAVGHQFYGNYFQQINRLLKPGGQLFIQSITMAEQNLDFYRKNVDFIQKYIFPGGCLPSTTELCQQLTQHTDLNVTAINDYADDYAKTIKDWYQRFNEHYSKINDLGFDQQFKRMWNFYLAYCEGGFIEKNIGLVHLQASKNKYVKPR